MCCDVPCCAVLQALKRMCWLADMLELSHDQEVALIAGEEQHSSSSSRKRPQVVRSFASHMSRSSFRGSTSWDPACQADQS
jgi:hypothetical protein